MAPVLLDAEYKTTTSSDPVTDATSSIPLGEYIFKRLQQVKDVKSIFGVPGDFNLSLLEHIYKTELNWVGGCNELNSGYAADGYSRYTNSLGVLITTYGVGELSAINAVAGAFAEYSKILHIVGIPSTNVLQDPIQKQKNLHHLIPNIDSLQNPDHFVYTKMARNVSCASKIIMDPNTAAQDIDEVIHTIFKKSKPGYIFLPADLSDSMIDGSTLNETPLFHKVQTNAPLDTIREIATIISNKIYESSSPSILADLLVSKYDNGVELLRNFVNHSGIYNYTTFMGKSILEESNQTFVGDYIGSESTIGIKENLEASDLILYFGSYINEINTGHYSFDFKEDQVILLHSDYIKIGQKIFYDVDFISVLSCLLDMIDTSRIPSPKPLPFEIRERHPIVPSKAAISQSVMLKKFSEFLKPNDVFVCETGSFMFGVPDIKFKKNMRYIAQGFYLSIGMGLPCAVGVGVAMRDEGASGRLILVEGDGSAQMTIQEISAFTHLNLSPIIFLLNNNGYTVERIIKGETRSYNDIKAWNWTKAFEFFETDPKKKPIVKLVSNEVQLSTALDTTDLHDNTLRFHEIILDEMDCPWRFHQMNGYKHFPSPH